MVMAAGREPSASLLGPGLGEESAEVRVLVVDDDAAQRLLLRKLLTRAGIAQVEFAVDVDSFIAAVERFDPDLVTLDLHLTGGDAFDAIGRITTCDPQWSRRRVLLVTGDTNPAVVDTARSLGIHRIVHKPFAIAEFLEAVNVSVAEVWAARAPVVDASIDDDRSTIVPATTDGPGSVSLIDAVRALADAHSLDGIAAVVRSAARRLTCADGATFIMRDGDSCHYVDEDAISPLWKGQRFPMSACISGWAMLNREIAIIDDIYADARIPHDVYRPTFVKSLVMVPVRTADPIAAIGTYWSVTRTPSDDEVRVLQALADSTAVALQNARLVRQLDTVHSLTADLTSANDQLRDFVQAVAHDLRGPLSTIQGLAELLAHEPGHHSGETLEAIDLIRASAQGLSAYVTDLLDFAVADGRIPDHETVPVRQLVDDATRRLADPIAARRASITVANDDDIVGDRAMLGQILQNLIANALAYVPADRDPHIRIDVARTIGGRSLIVSDNGDGVPPVERDLIFDAFRRGSNSGDRAGTGLGLALCRRAARRHGGDIVVRDAPTGGAEFIVTLPDAVAHHRADDDHR